MTDTAPASGAIERQQAIDRNGIAGRRPRVPIDYAELETAARSRLSAEAFAYIAGGAGRESTMAANRAAFERWRIVPWMLRDVDRRETSITLLGRRWAPRKIGI